jgi:transposase-like protein
MTDRSAEPPLTPRPTLTPAQRGQIIQRVIVDGWTSAEAASAAGVAERLVDAWVAAYRRHGMASLRHAPSKSAAAELFRLRLSRPLRAALRGIAESVRWISAPKRAAGPAQLRRSNEDGRGGRS